MAKLIARKAALILLLLPILNFLGFQYAINHPRYNPGIGASIMSLRTMQGISMPVYANYAKGLLRGDWGEFRGQPLQQVLGDPFRNSMVLLLLSLSISAIAGPIIGILSVSRRTTRLKPGALLASTMFLSMPGFFLGVAAIGLIIYLTLSGTISQSPIPLSGFGFDAHLIMPVVVLASRPTFHIARITGNLMENELQQDYVQVARSKGLSWFTILYRHAFVNVLSPVIITIGHSTRILIGALIIVETLFLWPGIGRLFMLDIGIRTDGRAAFDFFAHPQLLAALAVIFGGLLLLADLAASVAAFALDPRQARPTNSSTVQG